MVVVPRLPLPSVSVTVPWAAVIEPKSKYRVCFSSSAPAVSDAAANKDKRIVFMNYFKVGNSVFGAPSSREGDAGAKLQPEKAPANLM